jgi:hypothetical protein
MSGVDLLKILALLTFLVIAFYIGCDLYNDGNRYQTGLVGGEGDFADSKGLEFRNFTIFPVKSGFFSTPTNKVEYQDGQKFLKDDKIINTNLILQNSDIIFEEVFKWNPDGTKRYADPGGIIAIIRHKTYDIPEHNGWEWFVFDPEDGSILDRGTYPFNDACNQCHSTSDLFQIADHAFEQSVRIPISEEAVIEIFNSSDNLGKIFNYSSQDIFSGEMYSREDTSWQRIYYYQSIYETEENLFTSFWP